MLLILNMLVLFVIAIKSALDHYQCLDWVDTDFSVKSRYRYFCLDLYGFTVTVAVPCLRALFLDTGIRFSGDYFNFSHFGTRSVLVQFGIRWNLKLWYWNLN